MSSVGARHHTNTGVLVRNVHGHQDSEELTAKSQRSRITEKRRRLWGAQRRVVKAEDGMETQVHQEDDVAVLRQLCLFPPRCFFCPVATGFATALGPIEAQRKQISCVHPSQA